jgi:hypothetical protein
MADRITTYEQAFDGLLGIAVNDVLRKDYLSKLEAQGHTEKSICYAIFRAQDKLNAYRRQSNFYSILTNEINKWSWKKDDPRWQQWRDRKNEQERAANIRKEFFSELRTKEELSSIGKKKNAKGFIYFIQGKCGGAIKIGFSIKPEERLKALQTGYPDTLLILSMVPGSEATERAIHKELEAFRMNGEWFRPDDHVISFIKNVQPVKKLSGKM